MVRSVSDMNDIMTWPGVVCFKDFIPILEVGETGLRRFSTHLQCRPMEDCTGC